MHLISALKQVSVLQAEMKQLKQVRKSSDLVSQKPCFWYVRLSGEIIWVSVGKESLLGVEVSQYIRLVSCSSCFYKNF